MNDIKERLDRLEAKLDEQQERIERQEETIEQHQETIERQRDRIEGLQDDESEAESGGVAVMNRRSALKAGGLLTLFGAGTGAASADSRGQVGTSSDPLQT